jgi:hypothetical protein
MALRILAARSRAVTKLPRQATVFQQKRGMAGGEDEDESMFVNWWDNPTNPDLWHKHQLAWWGVAFWGVVFYTAFGGKKKEAAPADEAKTAVTAAAH